MPSPAVPRALVLSAGGRSLVAFLAVAAALAAIHLLAGGAQGHGTIRPGLLARVAVTPATTLSRWHAHFVAGFFHHGWAHLAFNLTLLGSAALLAARQGRGPTALAAGLVIGPVVVLLLHLVLVRPLAAAGSGYAVAALPVPLVGFSVMAYAMLGVAATPLPPGPRLAVAAAVLALELVVGLGLRATAPFVFVYHLVGFAAGSGWGALRAAGSG